MFKKLPVIFVLILFFHQIFSGYMPDEIKGCSALKSYNYAINLFCSTMFNLIKSDVSKPDYEVFKKALTGFLNLKVENKIKKNILTIIDFSKSSNMDRMWIIDMEKKEVLHLSLVAHGKNSGAEFACHFSNVLSSLQSSLGFFVTGDIFNSSHGMSLYLDGVEPGINDKARERGIIMHGAFYVGRDFIRQYGLLGRSFGCPAIPMQDHEKIITLLSGKSCIYIYSPDDKYQNSTQMLTEETAFFGISNFLRESPGIPDSGFELN
jgi:hypothetical protein